MKHFSRTKIVATIGPASHSVAKLEQMIKAGMRVARLNFSHGTHSDHADLIRNIREAAKNLDIEVGILQDLQGPRIRVGSLPNDGITVKRGQKIALVGASRKKAVGKLITIPIQYEQLYKDVKKGVKILIEDGTIQLKVLQIKDKAILTKVMVAGTIKTHKGINVPDVTLNVDVITDKDKKDIEFGQDHDVDYVALSFVKDASDIRRLHRLIWQYEKKGTEQHTKTIAKIERKEAIANFDSILEEVDGIMVARGDLGLELPAQEVPIHQKNMIQACLKAAKPIIVATQMLDSMIRNPQPTRAEVSDVANAVIDHTDAVMLSGESATGKYPVQAVQMMSNIASVTEQSSYDDLDCHVMAHKDNRDVVAKSVCQMHLHSMAKAVLVYSGSGKTVSFLSRYRLEVPVIVLTPNVKTARQLALHSGVITYVVSPKLKKESILNKGLEIITNEKIAKRGDTILFVKKGLSAVEMVEV